MAASRKCIIFGGSGFIGGHLTRKLLEHGHDVTIFVREHHTINIPGVKVVYGDFMNANDIDEAVKDNDYVFHLVSITTPASSDNDPFTDIETNVRMSIHLLESCARHKVKRVIYASTGGAIYGDSDKKMLSEEHVTAPISPYGIGKATVEGYLRYFKVKHNLDYVSLRISNTYGTGQNIARGNHGVIPIFLSQILNDKKVTVMGDGSMMRDYIYVDDLVNFMAKFFAKPHKHAIYNIGSGVGTTVSELLKQVEKVAGKKARIKRVKTPDSFVPSVILDTSRAVGEFGVIAKTSLKKGIKSVYQSMQATVNR